MSGILIYAIKSAIVLTLLLLPGILLLFRQKMFRLNRLTLLSIMGLSLLLPLCNLSPLSMDQVPAVQSIEQGLIEAGIPVETAFFTSSDTTAGHTPQLPWFYIVSILYTLGVSIVLAIRLREVFSMGRIIRRGSIWTKDEPQGIRIYCHAEQVAPFSWLHNIVISERDYRESGREIVLHETGHILHRHSLDILLLTLTEALQWWNPFVYLLGIYLRDVHEYQADDYVLRQGVSCHAYSQLIIRKAVGASSYTFANSFNHSLTKKRIAMMLKTNPKQWMHSRVLYVIPVATLALSAFATSEFQTASQVIEETVQAPVEKPLSDSIPAIQPGNEIKVLINGANEMLIKTSKDSRFEHVQPVQLMEAIRKAKGDCVLTIQYDEGCSMASLSMEAFKNMGRSNGKGKVNVEKKRFPYTTPGVEHQGTVRINADGAIWFYNKADDTSSFQDFETLKSRLSELSTDGYVLNIMPDKKAPTEVTDRIREIARECGIRKINMGQ